GFTSSLDHLLGTPALYGASWHMAVRADNLEDSGSVAAVARRDSNVAAVSEGYSGIPLALGRLHVEGMAMDAVTGASLMPTAVEGRIPATEPRSCSARARWPPCIRISAARCGSRWPTPASTAPTASSD